MPLGLTPEAVAAHRAAWADLAARALEPSIFSDPAFALPAALYLPGSRQPRFILAWDPREPSRLIGLCCVAPPLPGLPLSAWLHPQATAAFPLLDAEQPETALAGLLAQMIGRFRLPGLLMRGLPEGGATMRLVEQRPTSSLMTVERRSRAVLREVLPPIPGKAGKEFRRQRRRLAEQGHVATTAAVATQDALERFLDLEARGWKGARGTALAAAPRLARFTREMVTALAAEGRCRIHSLTLDDRPIAMGLVLRSGSYAFFWKTAYDEAFARFSPGAHLAEFIGHAQTAEPGLAFTDSCAIPGHSMIDRIWPGRTTIVDALLVPAPAKAVSSRVALATEHARRLARHWAKRMVHSRASKRLPQF